MPEDGDVSSSRILELNVGGTNYSTSVATLAKKPDSVLAQLVKQDGKPQKDSQGRIFLDRDGVLFRYILDYLRNDKLLLPSGFSERERLRQEADFYRLPELVAALTLSTQQSSTLIPFPGQPGFVTVGYRGTFAFGRDGLADVKFRKLTRILVSGKVTICREVFGDTLNESRDPDRGQDDRYTSRFFLKHNSIEQAFDMLQEAGFSCVAACGSGTSCGGISGEPLKPGMDSEENRWNHYNEFVFVRN